MKNKKKWYNKNLYIYILLIIFPPVGIYGLWKNNSFSINKKIIITSALCILGILTLTGSPPDNKPPSVHTHTQPQKHSPTKPGKATSTPKGESLFNVSEQQTKSLETQKTIKAVQDFDLGYILMNGKKIPIKTLIVSGENFTMNNRPAIMILFGKNKNNYFDISVIKSALLPKKAIKSKSRDNHRTIDSTARFGKKLYFQSAKHYSYIDMLLAEIDPANKNCLIQTSGVYVEPSSGKTLSFSAEINISNDMFDKLQLSS